MRICYVHLGLPKTGSTSIQSHFDGFDDCGIKYAPYSSSNHEMLIGCTFAAQPERLPQFRRREASAPTVKARVLKAKTHWRLAMMMKESIILSAEAVPDQLFPEEINRFYRELESNFDEVRTRVYVRPLSSLVASQFQQRIKMGGGEFRLPPPNYRKRIEPVLEAAPHQSVNFRKFDRDTLEGGDVVVDFARWLKLTPSATSRVLSRNSKRNTSLTSESVGAIYAFNKYIGPTLGPKQHFALLKKLLRNFADFGETKFGLSLDLVSAHMEKHRADVEWAERICGFDLSGDAGAVQGAISSENDLLSAAAELARTNWSRFQESKSMGQANRFRKDMK